MLSNSSLLLSKPLLISSPEEHKACFNSSKPILVLYTDPARCAPCRQLEPVFNKVAEAYTDIEFYVVKTSTPQLQTLIRDLSIQSIPVLVFAYNKKIITRAVGRLTEPELKRKIVSFKIEVAKIDSHIKHS